MWTGGWWSPEISTQYGNGTLIKYGEHLEPLYSDCITLSKDERIVKIAVMFGWYIDGIVLATNKKSSPLKLGGGAKFFTPDWKPSEDYSGPYTVLTPPQADAYLAAFTLYVSEGYEFRGLQVHWGKDVA
jgi:hypothetical protein